MIVVTQGLEICCRFTRFLRHRTNVRSRLGAHYKWYQSSALMFLAPRTSVSLTDVTVQRLKLEAGVEGGVIFFFLLYS